MGYLAWAHDGKPWRFVGKFANVNTTTKWKWITCLLDLTICFAKIKSLCRPCKTSSFHHGFEKNILKFFPNKKSSCCLHSTKKYSCNKTIHVLSLLVLYCNLCLAFWSFVLGFILLLQGMDSPTFSSKYFLNLFMDGEGGSPSSSIQNLVITMVPTRVQQNVVLATGGYKGSIKCYGFCISSRKCKEILDQWSISIFYR